ncbi:MAG: DUF4129 domain-containing protein [Micrococcales bacterium]|nr:DUF4129 domain-containing protein [Micrococcales bacterium]
MGEPPVTPDATTARQWASDELAHPAYHHSVSLLSRLLNWLGRQFSGLHALGMPPGLAVLVVVAILAVVVLVALGITGPVRRSRRVAARRAVLSHDDRRAATELRAAADAAAGAGDWSRAVAERFRAVVRDLEERAVLDERPGRTAHEVAADGGQVLPTAAGVLADGAGLFDGVVYGQQAADASDDATMRTVDQRVRAARRAPAAVAVAFAAAGPSAGPVAAPAADAAPAAEGPGAP